MDSDISDHDNRLFEDLQELIALEVKDILATADSEGYDRRDVVSALELALAAEINALRDGKPVEVEQDDAAVSTQG
jgi:uncharacterized protein (UPF0335 family)